ncbi:MAG TPA: hypothetical protein VHX61_06765 [Rhizomicrobium sp.]|jgi:hypothetical protein|nr:hypothetical protein [Rhizomicrobium sp.]
MTNDDVRYGNHYLSLSKNTVGFWLADIRRIDGRPMKVVGGRHGHFPGIRYSNRDVAIDAAKKDIDVLRP